LVVLPTEMKLAGASNDTYCVFNPISTKFINFSSISAKFINSPYLRSIYVFWLHLRFLASLFWPWCIYASCFTRTGRSRKLVYFIVKFTIATPLTELKW